MLVIDDDRDAREIATAALGAAGAEIVAVASPEEALEQTSNGSVFSVLVCDIGMRGMDGYEVLRRIRKQEAAVGRRTPAIAVTAHASAEDIARAKTAGFGWHVAKPVVVPTLLQTVIAAAAAASTSE